ncbi:MAG: hypothetical protein ICV51_13895 [Flavisolibacter sp.]|nr:hypothetical protein [Flavisolibacter sp.]MBD0287405.1 hypothetical protein [Flavisolibacter sp.]MBD0296988.1 hypothetical protein [Flavisolibacter sp.]MBD0352410.1 hypothetical protein [Flavisolibacter sp.]MBD0367789.1 hypothetical protein [Flavisolibacter sp.]
MARIFSISFLYENIHYSALIDVRTISGYTEYNISMIDDYIRNLLPGNKIISYAPNQFTFMNADTGNEVVMKTIIKAITDHIHSLQL